MSWQIIRTGHWKRGKMYCEKMRPNLSSLIVRRERTGTDWQISVWFQQYDRRFVMVWGCFRGERTGNLINVKGIMKREHHSILQRYTLPSGLHRGEKRFTFQQENDRKLSSNYIKISSIKKRTTFCKLCLWRLSLLNSFPLNYYAWTG